MTFKENDKLLRERYGELIKSILEKNHKYRRNIENKSFVLALDSPWGTGKTTFIKMLMNHLEESNQSSDVVFSTIYYNAWENDYWKNPFESLVQTILDKDLIDCEADNALAIVKNIGRLGGKIAAGFALKHTLGDGAVASIMGTYADGSDKIWDSIKSLSDTSSVKIKQAMSPQYIAFKENIKELKAALTEFVRTAHPKQEFADKKRLLVVFIDELDRCRPDFAIETLEIVKHLFDVEGLAFVFSVDIKELSSAASTIYGTNMDAVGYLMRFFDYVCKMPQYSKASFIQYVMSPESRQLKLEEFDVEDFQNAFTHIAERLELSLRDIETIYASFLILEEFELQTCPNLNYYITFLGLLCLKYKQPQTFIQYVNNDLETEERESVGSKIWPYRDNTGIYSSNRNSLYIKLPDLHIWDGVQNFSSDEKFGGIRNGQIVYLDGGGKQIIHNPYESNRDRTAHNHMFSIRDFQLWDLYKELTVGQYLAHKLEGFNCTSIQ